MKTLTLKNPEAHLYASAIAKETGETLTHIVLEALRQRLERVASNRTKAAMAALNEIASRSAALAGGPVPNHENPLLDEHGLPQRTCLQQNGGNKRSAQLSEFTVAGRSHPLLLIPTSGGQLRARQRRLLRRRFIPTSVGRLPTAHQASNNGPVHPHECGAV